MQIEPALLLLHLGVVLVLNGVEDASKAEDDDEKRRCCEGHASAANLSKETYYTAKETRFTSIPVAVKVMRLPQI